MASLLPPNSTAVEKTFEKAVHKATNHPVPVREIRRPDVAPAKFLPWLAWERSVDLWRDDWNTDTQRQVIAASIPFHQKKGTVGALKRALAAENWSVKIEEWFQFGGAPFTFKARINGKNKELNASSYKGIITTIERAKNLRSRLIGLNINVEASPATLWAGALCSCRLHIAVMPKS